jgi:N-acetylglucosamine-6-phosphate deacetylase
MAADPGARESVDMRLRRGARPATHNPQPATGTGPLILSGATVVLPTGTVKDGRVIVDGTRITGAAPDNAQVIDVTGYWLVPGFVDLHNHGGGGASFTSGTVEDVLKGIHTHRLHGTTTLVASTVTGEMDFLVQRAGLLSELAEQGDLAGIHFEGPFISPCRKGAHSEALLREPDPADVRKLVDAARGSAKMVTLATELPGGLDSVRLLVEHGVIAAIGHTDASYEQTVAAIDAGATVATHLFNAMPQLGHRERGAPRGRARHRRVDQRRYASPPGLPGAGVPPRARGAGGAHHGRDGRGGLRRRPLHARPVGGRGQ